MSDRSAPNSAAGSAVAVSEAPPQRPDAMRALLERRMQQRRAAAEQRGIPRRSAEDPAPLSLAQRRLWFLDRYEPDSSAHNIFRAFTLQGQLDVAALCAAAERLRLRQQALATIFTDDGDQPVQRVSSTPVGLPVVDLSAIDAPRR
ncbi:MAG: condensation domain-containing protein, partial [Acidobacteriota bacterium]